MRIINSNFAYSAHNFQQLEPSILPEFAFIGRSNVGKSSLINSLLNRRNLAQTSKKPGKTRSINIYNIACYDNRNKKTQIIFADLPGYGFARVSSDNKINWRNLLQDYIELRNNLKGFIIIVDIRHSLTKKDKEAISWIKSFQCNYVIAATKTDKLVKSKIKKTVNKLQKTIGTADHNLIIPYSSKTNFGKNKILNWIDAKTL